MSFPLPEEIPAKSILQRAAPKNYGWFGIDYNMNLYKGCCHGCIYCDSRSSCYRIEDFDRVRRKANTLEILEMELKSKRKKGVIGIGAMSDTYNPFEKECCLTRGALKLIRDYGFGVSLDTKSSLAVRDLELFARISREQPVIVKFTITAADDAVAAEIEPGVCVSSSRFAAMEQLSRAGIFTGVLMTPLLPFLTDTPENVKNIVRLAAEHQARFVYGMFGVTLRENQREYYFRQLDRLHPGLSKRYRQIYADQYLCESQNSKALAGIFRQECEKYGLLYRMKDIIEAYRKIPSYEQMKLMF